MESRKIASGPSRGLIIMRDPLEKILRGTKTLELRKSGNRQSGSIALIQKSSGHVVGVADIGQCVAPMSWPEFTARAKDHAVEPERLKEVFDSGYVYGWPLKNIQRLGNPVAYQHPSGAVIWVTLDEGCVRNLRTELGI